MAKSKAIGRYNRRVIALSLIYAAALVFAVYCFKHQLLSGPLAWIAGILPALPIIGILVVIGRYLAEETDEYLRMRIVEQVLIATGFLLAATTLYGFLNAFDLAPRMDAYLAVPLWAVGLGIGRLLRKDPSC